MFLKCRNYNDIFSVFYQFIRFDIPNNRKNTKQKIIPYFSLFQICFFPMEKLDSAIHINESQLTSRSNFRANNRIMHIDNKDNRINTKQKKISYFISFCFVILTKLVPKQFPC